MATEEQMNRDIDKIFSNGFSKNRHSKKRGKLSKKQISTLTAYKRYYENKPSSKGGKIKLPSLWNALSVLRYLGVFLQKPYEEATKEDLINWVISLNGRSSATMSNWKVLMRGFYKWLYQTKDRFPDVVDDDLLKPERIKTTRTSNMLLTRDEIKRMLEVAQSYKQKSVIMLTFGEGSLRGGEVCSCNVRDCIFDTSGVKLWVRKSKSKERYVRLTDSEYKSW